MFLQKFSSKLFTTEVTNKLYETLPDAKHLVAEASFAI